MKRVPVGGLLVFMCLSLFGAGRETEWKQVEDAVQRGLPKTAITNLEVILKGAMQERAYPEAVKALGQKIALEGTVQGNRPEERITRLEAEIAGVPAEMAPVLDTLLAHWYWNYFQQNRWRFMQRTATGQPPGKDFTTWDLPRLFARIDAQFRKALAAEKLLKATPVGAWDNLLEKGALADAYRPTLYDFIAGEALTFYTSGETAAALPEGAFELSADSPALAPAKEFLAWKPANLPGQSAPASRPVTEETGFSPALRAIDLYQVLLRFHQADPAPQPALASADLDRLTWAGNAAFGESKDERYQASLDGFIRRYGDLDISALAYEHEARVLQRKGDLGAAHQLAKRGAELFPQAPGGKLCANLLVELEAKSASIVTERVWNETGAGQGGGARTTPMLKVVYRNVKAVYFKAIAYDWKGAVPGNNGHPEFPPPDRQRELLSRPPALQWSEKLPPTTDYREQTFESRVPAGLKPGFYFIAASHDPAFGERENLVSVAPVWVSDLALVTRQRTEDIEGFVLEAVSGEPLAGVSVSVWHTDNRGQRVADPTLTTDENGGFTLKKPANGAYLFLARDRRGRELGTPGEVPIYEWLRRPETHASFQTVFFTDRAIYRPGQTIQYKGICLAVDQEKNNYSVLKGETLTVVFLDANGKEIERQKRQANDYGSFAGSFTAPRDRLMGRMSLSVEGRARGAAGLSVEEYKRPKFQVTLDAPKAAPRLNGTVSLAGHALGYTGAAIDDAQVRFRVVREVRMPWWWGWWGAAWRGSENQEIAHGTVRTATDGSFTLEFTAKPDPKVLEKDEPTFVFSVSADVTDNAGETRSAVRGVNVGYTALTAQLSADPWQTEDRAVEIKLETKTLDGEPQLAEGKVVLYELQAPATVQRPPLGGFNPAYQAQFGAGASPEDRGKDLSDPNQWPLGKAVTETGFTTDTNGVAKLSFKLAAGEYRAAIESQDRFGKKVTGRLPIRVLKPTDTRLAIELPFLLDAPRWEAQPGGDFFALWGTGYDSGRAYIEIEQRHQMIQRYWTKPGQTQQAIHFAVTEALRGGFTLHVTQVRENRAWLESRRVDVPWKNKELELKWEHFVSKLQPGQKETWSLAIKAPASGPGAEQSAAELVAALYDESLDAFQGHDWPERFSIFRQDFSTVQAQFGNTAEVLRPIFGRWDLPLSSVAATYRSFPASLTERAWGYRFSRRGGLGGAGDAVDRFGLNRAGRVEDSPMSALAPMAAPAPATMMLADKLDAVSGAATRTSLGIAGEPLAFTAGGTMAAPAGPKPDLSQVSARKNLNETAFFFPQLTADANGVVRLTFTMPEALTRWRFLGFAHDASVRSGLIEAHAVTAKDLMVQPNPPRFLREDDIVEFTVKISNQSDARQAGTVRLTFNDALTDAVPTAAGAAFSPSKTDRRLGNTLPEQPFDLPPKESRSCSWRLHIPDGCGFLTYQAVAATATVSDGEEGAIPVLSRRILVTESLPLPIRGPATKQFEFSKLLQSGGSKTLRNQSLTVQMVSNPAWYAVLALPYLMEFPYECSEQTFNRFYADALARHIANRDPKIRRIFDLWKNTPALESPLEKSQDLKAVMIEETPWLRQAQAESQARRNVGLLFDDNRLNNELAATLQKLADLQLADGSWPWFPGGPRSDYITLYITTGFGRLRHLGVDVSVAPALRSLARLDEWMAEEYRQIHTQPTPDAYVPSSTDALYLYGRSFFLKDAPIAPAHRPAIDFFLQQARRFWLPTGCRQTQGHLAIALHRFQAAGGAADPTPKDILRSLKERSVSTEEMGMFWRDTELSWWWYRAPIETEALMIEAFDEVAGDQAAVEGCRVWLLKQKQTRDWKTTKATADAVYALLLRGQDILSSQALVHITLGGQDLTPEPRLQTAPATGRPSVEPGTGFYEVRFAPADIKTKLGAITVTKSDTGVAWGSVHWQYLEDMTKVTPYEGTPLKLKKALFLKTATSRGQVLEPVKGPVKVGDELVVRIELRVDRDMEYVHLKDQRGSGTEPVSVLSRYQYQDGLAYYESTRDTASHFFIDYLPKGTYVFEYSTRVQLRGEYQTGVAQIQCLYAPEFNSHSESIPVVVR